MESLYLVGFAVVAVIAFIFVVILFNFFGLWLRARIANAPVGIGKMVGMRLRRARFQSRLRDRSRDKRHRQNSVGSGTNKHQSKGYRCTQSDNGPSHNRWRGQGRHWGQSKSARDG